MSGLMDEPRAPFYFENLLSPKPALFLNPSTCTLSLLWWSSASPELGNLSVHGPKGAYEPALLISFIPLENLLSEHNLSHLIIFHSW